MSAQVSRSSAWRWALVGALGMAVAGLAVVGVLALVGKLPDLSAGGGRAAVPASQGPSGGSASSGSSAKQGSSQPTAKQSATTNIPTSPIEAAMAQAGSDLSALKAGSTDQVYNGASVQLRDGATQDDFTEQVSNSPVLQGWQTIGTPLFVATTGKERPSDLRVLTVSTIDFTLPLSTPTNTEQLQLEYVLEDGAWKLNGFTAAGGQGAVGKVGSVATP
jgi:hypothetical protein